MTFIHKVVGGRKPHRIPNETHTQTRLVYRTFNQRLLAFGALLL